jgi:hypothetical protein
MFEMEQVLPGSDPEDFDTDPIVEANELKEMGDTEGAQEILSKMLEADLRCLDAHAHLGNMLFRTSPHWALSHFEVGVGIGELSLGADFDGVLAWGLIDNRPFLRCMQGYGLCLWRLERWEQAARVRADALDEPVRQPRDPRFAPGRPRARSLGGRGRLTAGSAAHGQEEQDEDRGKGHDETADRRQAHQEDAQLRRGEGHRSQCRDGRQEERRGVAEDRREP